ncbi:RBBP9/YdeN family alpha/beta hydrolase [Streptomyces rishiriensis]|uniref:Alpha/beta hydrolase family esterase n=1 Tax=Streptomyces rishiriensis TaxID=68264 RepID=A0ABU0NQX7_STRRH|nr:alpha/beta hydrolase [Streptomyces rishiriensis]MDQ0581158.1 putative alpha/beta hydrolase family esterase [Streptomyces rishiriensis]
MTTRSYLILHGWQNHRPEDHWQHWLADRLTELGHEVAYPQLPDPDDPDLEAWLTELARRLDGLAAGSERVVVAHSLSVLLWLHAVVRDLPGVAGIDRVLLVAPPSGSVVARYPEIEGFGFAGDALGKRFDGRALPHPTRLVAGDDDPYLPEGVQAAYGDSLGLTAELLPGAGHLDLDAGYGSWPSVLEWCLDGEAELTVRE